MAGNALHVEPHLDRRQFVVGTLGTLLLPLWPRASRADMHGKALPAATRSALAESPYVYVSPLRSDGEESTCHGEVWYGWFDGAVFLTTATSTWKARSVAHGLDRARIWVGDYGRWKRVLGRNEAFREGPSFEARVSVVDDPEKVRRLLAELARKYPEEFPSWKERMQQGHRDGSRVLLRYAPIG